MFARIVGHVRGNTVAYLALFFALSGTAIAAKPLLTGADIQDGSLTGADVQNDSLTGNDVLESSLGKVPSATAADSATTAGDAEKLDGKDSSEFLQGSGRSQSFQAEVDVPPPPFPAGIADLGDTLPGGAFMQGKCASPNLSELALNNPTTTPIRLWRDDGGSAPVTTTLQQSSDIVQDAASADRVTWHGTSSEGSFTVTAFAADGAPCHFSAEVLTHP